MLTLFTVPKPFSGHIGDIQRNAIESWRALRPDVQVILVGDEEGVAEAAREAGVDHVGGLARNDRGTPRLDSAFECAESVAESALWCLVNADIVLLDDFLASRRARRISVRRLPDRRGVTRPRRGERKSRSATLALARSSASVHSSGASARLRRARLLRLSKGALRPHTRASDRSRLLRQLARVARTGTAPSGDRRDATHRRRSPIPRLFARRGRPGRGVLRRRGALQRTACRRTRRTSTRCTRRRTGSTSTGRLSATGAPSCARAKRRTLRRRASTSSGRDAGRGSRRRSGVVRRRVRRRRSRCASRSPRRPAGILDPLANGVSSPSS